MGIVEEKLAAFEFSNGQQHRVELNMGGTIHLHMGNVRLDMTEEEFRHFVSVVSEARDRLREEKSLDGSEGASADETPDDGSEASATDPAAKAQDDD